MNKFFKQTPVFLLCALATVLASGCCVSNTLAVKNDTGHDIAFVSANADSVTLIPSGRTKEVAYSEGQILIVSSSHIWLYQAVDVHAHPEVRRRVFRFGICQLGFGYFQTLSSLDQQGHLHIGHSDIAPTGSQAWH